mmetsp:Transcript_81852/g.228034  ORF Transcript_81852/g.228034 Transcript_81852/m.228034 type:complete len:267 (-) Transcript_81852:718-1518(-)
MRHTHVPRPCRAATAPPNSSPGHTHWGGGTSSPLLSAMWRHRPQTRCSPSPATTIVAALARRRQATSNAQPARTARRGTMAIGARYRRREHGAKIKVGRQPRLVAGRGRSVPSGTNGGDGNFRTKRPARGSHAVRRLLQHWRHPPKSQGAAWCPAPKPRHDRVWRPQASRSPQAFVLRFAHPLKIFAAKSPSLESRRGMDAGPRWGEGSRLRPLACGAHLAQRLFASAPCPRHQDLGRRLTTNRCRRTMPTIFGPTTLSPRQHKKT